MTDWRCSEALQHSEADRDGRCSWCGRKIGPKMPRNWNEIRKRNLELQDPLTIEPDPDEEYWSS